MILNPQKKRDFLRERWAEPAAVTASGARPKDLLSAA
jgi:hypothetical protein